MKNIFRFFKIALAFSLAGFYHHASTGFYQHASIIAPAMHMSSDVVILIFSGWPVTS